MEKITAVTAIVPPDPSQKEAIPPAAVSSWLYSSDHPAPLAHLKARTPRLSLSELSLDRAGSPTSPALRNRLDHTGCVTCRGGFGPRGATIRLKWEMSEGQGEDSRRGPSVSGPAAEAGERAETWG